MSLAGSVQRVEKLMTLSEPEFDRSLALLLAQAGHAGGGRDLCLGRGRVRIAFGKLPPRRFGRSLELPAARIVLTFIGVEEGTRAEFLRRFDAVFQRGGG